MAPRTALHLSLALAVALTGDVALGFTPMENRKASMPSSQPISTNTATGSADSVVAQKMLSSFGIESERGDKTQLSNSILASCDILPSFRTAHGILSPETVYRMAENTGFGEGNPAVSSFLSKYQESGPMSCLDFLSDADILPHLTRAMRDVF